MDPQPQQANPSILNSSWPAGDISIPSGGTVADRTFSEAVMREIEGRKLSPKPSWWFFLRNTAAWSATAGATVLVGATASVTVFILSVEDWDALPYIDRSVAKQALVSMPYLWLGVFLVFAVVAHYSFRSTRNGYRYETKRLIAAGLAASCTIGVALVFAGVGERVHAAFLAAVPGYDSIVYTNEDLWANPNRGLLWGTVLGGNERELLITDRGGSTWAVTAEASAVARLGGANPGQIVKVVGAIAGPSKFAAVQLLGWEE